jgi:hypothetical protein
MLPKEDGSLPEKRKPAPANGPGTGTVVLTPGQQLEAKLDAGIRALLG